MNSIFNRVSTGLLRVKKSVSTLFLAPLLCIGSITSAFSFDLITQPGQNPHRPYLDQTGWEQIDTYTRALRLSFVDVHLPGNGDFDLKVYRNYDSRGKDKYYVKPFGHGWTMHMGYVNITSELRPSKLCGPNPSQWYLHNNWPVTLHTPNGEIAQFIESDVPGAPRIFNNRWKLDCSRTTDAMIVVTDPEGSSYQMNPMAHQDELTASQYFMTTRITDRNGNWASIAYSQPFFPGGGRQLGLSSITTSDGRSVIFNSEVDPMQCDPDVGQCGKRLKSITAAGQTTSYQYCAASIQDSSTKLVGVTMPDQTRWQFGYHGGVAGFCNTNDLSLYDFANDTQIPRFHWGLSKIITPQGGEVNYAYTVAADPLLAVASMNIRFFGWQLTSKTTSGTNAGSWQFSNAAGSHTGIATIDTTVNGPEGITLYKHARPVIGDFSVWRHGLLLMKQSAALQTESYSYAPQKVSTKPMSFLMNATDVVDPTGTNLPILNNKTIIRDGATYATTYANHDAYGNPQTITESGPNGGYRQTARSYFVDTAKWIINKPKDESFPGSSVIRTFDANANLISQNANGIVTSNTYDAQGNVSSTTFPGNKLHTYGNYYRGIARSESQPEGINLSRTVSDAGNITSETNGEGQTTYYTYDTLNRVTGIQRPLGTAIGIAYTANTRNAVRGGLVDYSQYDGFGRMTYQSIGGIAKHYTYDAAGRLIYQSNPGSPSVGTGFAYDILGRKTAISRPGGATTAMGYGAGFRLEVNERGHSTTRYFKAYGNPDATFDTYIETPIAASSISMARNAVDQITTVSQNGLSRSYSYNSAYQLIGLSDPEIGFTAYGRDAAGNMTTKQTTGGGVINYYYDGQNRLYHITPPPGNAIVRYWYDRNNRMTWTLNEYASRAFTYDANGNALADTLTVDGQTIAASYTFDALDNPSYTHYSLSGRSVFLAPDALGRPTQASGFASGIQYFPSGQIYSIAHTNGVGSYYGQNARLWPASHVVLRGSTALVNNAYTYDNTGNVTSVIDYAGQSYGRVFGYDALERLTTANGPWGSGAITYDARGNVTGQSLGSFNTGMAYNATTGQLQSAYIAKDGTSSTSYPTYDNAGHMTFDGKNQFFFTVLDQLTCANCHTLGRETRYGYDGLGMRVWSQKGNPSNPSAPLAKTYEFHSRDNRLLMEWQSSAGSTAGFTKEHIYAGQRRIAEVHTITGQAAKVTHAHPDPSGSPAMLSDASGLVSAREHYRPYGDKLFSPNTNESAGFANKAFDASTNLSYMSARYYNPTLGRFISPDPVHFIEGNIHSFNRYAYANNNPMRYIDPTGLEGESISETDKTEKSVAPREELVAMGWIAKEGLKQGLKEGTKQGLKQGVTQGLKQAPNFSRSQLQHEFQHAKAFGVKGNPNNKTLAEFQDKLTQHVLSPQTQTIQGTYRSQPAIHHLDPKTGLNVFTHPNGNFWGSWQLSPLQLNNVVTRGAL
jgi:RHS repeat-associated protein